VKTNKLDVKADYYYVVLKVILTVGNTPHQGYNSSIFQIFFG
jgi:hypothetical protein